jgi:hypothetical protein
MDVIRRISSLTYAGSTGSDRRAELESYLNLALQGRLTQLDITTGLQSEYYQPPASVRKPLAALKKTSGVDLGGTSPVYDVSLL